MAFKIDPDAVPLYKELKPVHAAFKKAIKQQPADHIIHVLSSVFGSTTNRFSVTDKNQNMYEDVVWTSPVRAPSIGALFKAALRIHLDDDSNATSADMQDQWIYGARLPLYLKMELHSEWKNILTRTTQRLNEPTTSHCPLLNIWDEQMLIENLGWVSNDDDPAILLSVSTAEAEVARFAMQALRNEASTITSVWPNIAPWLNAMQGLLAPPDVQLDSNYNNRVFAWQEWSLNLKRTFLTSGLHSTLALPVDFSSMDLNAQCNA